MNNPFSITTERVDDIPLLLAQMQRMGLPGLLDAHFPTHGNRQGLSLGTVTTIWLTHLLSQADHRMNQVQPWAQQHLETVRGCSDPTFEVGDVGDDRLADVLRDLSDDDRWRQFEQALNGQLLRVYDLRPRIVRLDSSTASSYASVTQDGLLQFGHSKDHRPDLPQLKVMLASLDPLGLPLATEVLSGQRADDPLYLPAVARVRVSLGQRGLLYVGDCKMGALSTRAGIHAGKDFYLCPLSALVVPPGKLAELLTQARARGEPPQPVERPQADGSTQRIAEGYEDVETLTAQVDGTAFTWSERRLLVRSLAGARAAEQGLRTRLVQAQTALSELMGGRQGKPKLAERGAVDQAVSEVLTRYRVEGLLQVTVTEQVSEQAVRPYRDRPATVRLHRQFTITSRLETDAVEQAIGQLGWRVYATNHAITDLSRRVSGGA